MKLDFNTVYELPGGVRVGFSLGPTIAGMPCLRVITQADHKIVINHQHEATKQVFVRKDHHVEYDGRTVQAIGHEARALVAEEHDPGGEAEGQP